MIVATRKMRICWLMFVIVISYSQGISIHQEKGILSEEDKRGSLISESKNALISSKEEPALRAKATNKRGILPLGDQKRYGLDPPRYGDYEPGRYGGSGGGYPPSDFGPIRDDRPPPLYEPDGPYHHHSGGYVGSRPSGYGPNYGPHPGYHGYEDEYGHGHSGIGTDSGYGGIKALTLKKILIPLAGLAILGVAAAASQNPVLLQLGTVSGRRKRSLLPPDIYPSNPRVKPFRSQ